MQFTPGTLDVVHSATAGDQVRPSVATLANGNTVVVWTSLADGRIYSRQFDASGDPVSEETVVAAVGGTVSEFSVASDVAALAGGGFVVVWSQAEPGTPNTAVLAQVLDSNGVPEGNPITIATGTDLAHRLGSEGVDALPDGGYLVSYHSLQFPGPFLTEDIFSQRVGADGQLIGEPVLADIASGNAATETAVLPGGGWVTTSFQFMNFSSDNFQSRSHQFDAEGNLIATYATSGENQQAESEPDVVALPEGGYLMVWLSGAQVQGQFFDPSGNALGEVATFNESAGVPELTVLADGTLLLAWQVLSQAGLALYAQHLSAAGQPLGDVFSLGGAETPSGNLTSSWDVSATPDGGFVVATQLLQGAGEADIFIQDFDPLMPPPPVPQPPPSLNGKDLILGTDAAEALFGGNGKDTLFGAAGDDTIDGGNGVDVAAYAGPIAQYVITRTADGYTVRDTTGVEGTDTLVNVERLAFEDVNLAIDTHGHGGMAFRLYQAAFNRMPDLPGLGYQIAAMDNGLSLQHVAAHFVASPEFQQSHASLDDTGFVTQLYANVLHREPESEGLAHHLQRMQHGASRGDVLAGFSESPENQANVIGTSEAGMVYTG